MACYMFDGNLFMQNADYKKRFRGSLVPYVNTTFGAKMAEITAQTK